MRQPDARPWASGWARRIWKALGPGLITGAADDDPSGIATYSQAGAQYGYALTWTMLLTMPFMSAIQIISACIGWQTGKGLARSLAARFPRPAVHALVALLVVANTINVAADLAAMGESLRLVVSGPAALYAFVFGLGSLIAQTVVPYHRYAGYLKYLTMVLLVYVGAALTLHIPWGRVVLGTLAPSFSHGRAVELTVVAVFGTTISPYLFFWQASQEAEESRLSHRRRRGGTGGATSAYFRHIAFDTCLGMAVSNLIGFFIIVTTAATFNAHGITRIDTASQAAEALRPIAGELTFILFAAGIIGTGLLALPVLTGSAAYALAEMLGLKGSLELPARRARGFYAILAFATVAGAALAASRLNPIELLFWAAVINGTAAVPIMLAMMVLVSDRRGREAFRIPRWLRALGWLAAALMALAVAVYFESLIG
ncbi:MAG TPA: divalent metal cation transporter [Steroidobacteraceae bacterium]|nr:divalent metal cation transporter [Steroidobacteraceae bacterium]